MLSMSQLAAIFHGRKILLHVFSERLEIFSPGSIPNSMIVDTMPPRQMTRNELLARMLSRCPIEPLKDETMRRYVMERCGEGVAIILTEGEKLSGKRLEYR